MRFCPMCGKEMEKVMTQSFGSQYEWWECPVCGIPPDEGGDADE